VHGPGLDHEALLSTHALALESTASQWRKSRESTGPLVWPPVFNHHFRGRLSPRKTSRALFTRFTFCLRQWLSCRNMANFSFVILLLSYLMGCQRMFSLRWCLQALNHVMQK